MQEIVDRLQAADRGADIARTLLLPYLNHAATMFESGYATKADIDASMRFGCGYPVGPLDLVDALGAATVVSGLEKLHAETGDPLHVPAGVLTELAAGGTFADKAAAAGGDDAVRLLLAGTNFQIKVWEALLRIPPGSVCTYEDVAQWARTPLRI